MADDYTDQYTVCDQNPSMKTETQHKQCIVA